MASTKNKPLATELQLQQLKGKDKPSNYTFKHIPGLVVVVSKKGIKRFHYDKGSHLKKAERFARYGEYGVHPCTTLADVRTLHENTQAAHRTGRSTASLKASMNTVNELADSFLKLKQATLKRPDVIEQILNSDVKPYLGTMKISDVTIADVRSVVTTVIDRGSTSHAGKVLSVIKTMFNYAIGNGLLTSVNPATALTKDALGVTNNRRTRIVSPNELKEFWDILEANNTIVTRTALQLLALLGLRTGELRLSEWKHLDIEAKTLSIPAANQKLLPSKIATAKSFVVPLDDFALSLFEKLRGLDETYIFIGTEPNKPIGDKVLARYTKRTLEREGLESFTPHDLRRTCRTGLSELKVAPHVAEKCLNHSLGTIQETYNLDDFLDERREALNQWSKHLQKAVL